jgi:predicted transcriptional regulator
MENDAGIEKLFFELASESRLAILRELQNENLRMQEIARRLDVTATEAFRQLERLSAALLVQRQPDGTFAISEYGKLVLQLSSSLEFVSKHKDYFSTHDIMRLPLQFVNRLGELSQANLVMDTVENLNNGERAFTEAEQYGWGIAEGTVPEHMIPKINEQIQRGIKFKFLIPENRLSTNVSQPATPKNVEGRGLPDLPAIVVLTEKEAGICFRQVGGRVDYAGFFGKDPTFLNWVKDLFLYYWERGKRTQHL